MRNISFRPSFSTINLLSDNDAACVVIVLALCLRMYESPLHQRKVHRKTTINPPTTLESYHVEEAKVVQKFSSCNVHYMTSN